MSGRRAPQRTDFSLSGWPPLARCAAGTFVGALVGMLLSGIATLVRITSGTGAFTQVGATYGRAIAAYMIGCTAGGLIGGLLAPRARGTVSKALVGSVAVAPFWTAIVFTQADQETATARLGFIVVASLVSGSFWGVKAIYD